GCFPPFYAFFFVDFGNFEASKNELTSLSRNMKKPLGVLRLWLFLLAGSLAIATVHAQNPGFRVPLPLGDTAGRPQDSVLRIRNMDPYFTVHVDSTLAYQFEINRDPANYYFFLRHSPVGLKIRENGLLTFRADKSYFLSGRLKYDYEYHVNLGVQNLNDPKDRLDTTFTISFFTTEIIPSHVKPTLSSVLYVD